MVSCGFMIPVANPSPESDAGFGGESFPKSEVGRQYKKTFTVIIFPVVAPKCH